MTLLETEAAEAPILDAGADDAGAAPAAAPDGEAAAQASEHQPVSPLITSVAVFLSVAAAGWMCGALFAGGVLPRLVGVLGAAIGTGGVGLSSRMRRPAIGQYLTTVAAVLAGVALVAPSAAEGGANLPVLVLESLRTGGIATPPVPFEPGWRFVLVVLIAVLGVGATSLSLATRRPKLGVLMPLPLVIGPTILQPHETPILFTAIGVVLVPAAITVSHGADLARDGSTTGRFELRRLLRSGAVLAGMVLLLVVLGRLGLVFPEPNDDQIVPPQRPQNPPEQRDRVLFRVDSERETTWRVGVLDVYDGQGWLLPSLDPRRLESVPPNGQVPRGSGADAVELLPGRPTYQAKFTLNDVEGRSLPSLAMPLAVRRADLAIDYDPRTQQLRLPAGRARPGTAYTIEAPVPPGGAELSVAAPPNPALAPFLEVPPPPEEVVTLLGRAPANPYDRLQFVRNEYYTNVVAAGGGKPTDVPPARVVSLLAGQEGTPYEITAGEALLARWAGIPARIGFGWHGGDRVDGSATAVDIRPRHGAAWLEAYFEGYGWIPFVGVPPKAKASLNDKQKQQDPDVRPSANLALTTYVPLRVSSIRLFFEIARYWLSRALPFVAGLLLAAWLYPMLVKRARRWKRRRWGAAHGPWGRILVAYAELRDGCADLNVGTPYDSPVELLAAIEPDAAHEELAWLVTRALWGDLRRDLVDADADAAEELARSVLRRLRRAHKPTVRAVAAASRVSLRQPYTSEIPNLWPVERAHTRLLLVLRHPLRFRRASAATAAVLAVVTLLVVSSIGSKPERALVASPLPEKLAPPQVGAVRFEPEPSLEVAYERAPSNALVDQGHVFSLREGTKVRGSLQIARFKPGLLGSKKDIDDVRNGVTAGLGRGAFKPQRVGRRVLLTQTLAEQRLLLWFDPEMVYFELMVTAKDFEEAPEVFAAVLAAQQGEALAAVPRSATSEEPDPRRGGVA